MERRYAQALVQGSRETRGRNGRSMSNSVAQQIKEAFERARQQPIDAHMPRKPQPKELRTIHAVYNEQSARQFTHRADELIAEALRTRHLTNPRKGAWNLGDLDKKPLNAEQIFAEIRRLT
jgi:hypothetical protein